MNELGHSEVFTSTSEIHDQHEEVSSKASSSHSILGDGSGLVEFKIEPATRKNGKENFPL